MTHDWLIDGAEKDAQSITADWQQTSPLIDGVRIREVSNVPKDNGWLTEVCRREWLETPAQIDQVFQVVLNPGMVSAWHAHATTIDRLFVSFGLIRIVLYDAREASPTRGVTNEFRFGTLRPALLVVPPRVWHGVGNLSPNASVLLNLVDNAYRYEDPDHWRLPPDSPEIPYRFARE
jgi:dTDP-4-dehydrorhamnose 3,5-epimerase